ncbi:DUF2294 domain-containing protein [uncultured Clostridium sp.]|uniref:DUF2294 domain-containing protein n=1 Tax=uncultured Clostridium sp. TaxID=59620 RepID=UPI0028E69C6B|nr:DUF2294 domain-containing protein [uncultured Clostridium sp.]
MTRGQLESKISEAVSKFEIEFMGRGPKEIKTIIYGDMIIVRLKGFLSQSEKKLAENTQGVKLIKEVRTALFENERGYFDNLVKEITNVNVVSAHSDVSTRTGEKIIILTVDEDLESRLNNK